jgi:hypothetical protein
MTVHIECNLPLQIANEAHICRIISGIRYLQDDLSHLKQEKEARQSAVCLASVTWKYRQINSLPNRSLAVTGRIWIIPFFIFMH